MLNRINRTVIGAISVSIAAILWGLDGVVLTPRLYNLDINYVVFMLHLIPFVIMSIVFGRQYKMIRQFSRGDVFLLLAIALLGGALGTMAIVKALFLVNFKDLTIVVLLQKLQPVFAILLAAMILKERIGKRFVLWAGIAIVASYFLTFGFALPDFSTGSKTAWAAFFALLAAASFGSSTVFSKKILEKYNFITVTFYRYGFTAMIMLVIMMIVGSTSQFAATTQSNWIIFLLIGHTTGSGAIYLYYYGLKNIRAIVSAICELFFPVSAIIFDYLVNHNRLSAVQWVSAALMIFAIIKLNQTKN